MACPAGWFRRGFHFPPNINIMHNDDIPDQRSGFENDNIQELLDAAVSAGHALQVGAQQYQTPPWLARGLAAQLPSRSTPTFDPQCAAGNLLMAMSTNSRFGWDLDARHAESNKDFINRIRGNCVKLGATLADIAPDLRFPCIVANPPFGIRWKTESGSIDSTEWTWQFIASRLAKNGFGFLISSRSTIERLGLHEHSWTYAYQTFPKGIWENTLVEIGVVHFINWNHRPSATCPWPARVVRNWDHLPSTEEMAMSFRAPIVYPDYFYAGDAWRNLETIAKEERSSRSRFNIYLTERGILRTYLSTRNRLKLRHDQIERLFTINDAHPLTLTTDRATRKLLAEVVSSGIYTIEPEAEKAIKDALAEVANISCPIVPITDFEKVAYADEEDHLKARLTPKSVHSGICTTPGKLYELRTGSYTFSEKYYRTKLHWDEDTDKTRVEQHECVLSGSDRFIEFTDDRGHVHRFMERPRKREAADRHYEHPESILFDLFEEPTVPTVAEVMASEYRSNLDSMRFNERLNGFKYFPGQLDYYARMSTKKSGLVAAAVGTGKTLGALTLVAVKSPGRTIIIAPQGTMRSTEDDDEVEYQASQWVQEIQRFASSEPVFQLFSEADWRKILHANGGVAPNGIYITYPQAYFSNHAFEVIPHTWDDDTPAEVERKFCERAGLKFNKDRAEPDYYSNGVGKHDKAGIRCIAEPSLATIVASEMGEWDMVIIDEAHLCCNLDATITKNLLRLQPKYRFALTATPIPNIITNLFSLMGWLCVDDWYLGDRRNAAWPYAVTERGRFESTFLSWETDITQQQQAKAKGKKGWKNVGIRTSPIISSPARLLKLLKPTMAYISKEACNPDLKPCEIIDVRVPVGSEQARLYNYWLERRHYLNEYKSMLTIARVQSSRLRGICGAPVGLDYNRILVPKTLPTGETVSVPIVPCRSNFNPKTVAMLKVAALCLGRKEQVVVVSARVGQSNELARRFTEAGVPIARIDSTVAPELHAAEANRFKRGDARVMLMGIKCAQGHSFDQCPNLIIGSLEWSYGTLAQAQGRVWRLTSPKPVKVWVVLHENTIEEVLFDRVATKRDAATLCLHGRRVPRDFKPMDMAEILAEHIESYRAQTGKPESECEAEWPELCQQIANAHRGIEPEAMAA